MRVRVPALLALSLTVALSAAGQPPPERVSAELLLDRAARYLDFFIDQFQNVVAEERSTQEEAVLLPYNVPRSRGVQPSPPSAAELRSRHRVLVSDFLVVRSPDTSVLLPFRDVLTVDGSAVREREQRLSTLFAERPGNALNRARQVTEEGARYGVSTMRSTLGNPVLALGVLQVSSQRRFRFTLGKQDKSVGPGVWILEFREDAAPTMTRGEGGADLFARGRAWIEASSGRVYKTELRVEQPAVRATVITTFRLDERLGVAVPSEMREQYALENGGNLTMVATYGPFHRFDTGSDEDMHAPRRAMTDSLTGMTMIEVPPGRFTMGSAEAGRNDDETIHDVEITRPFLLGRYEVTQQEWRDVMGGSPSQFATCGPKCPVENVSFPDVRQFLDTLNARADGAGGTLRYRLPTEAEWEYACRAGTTGPFSTGDGLTAAEANYNGRQPYGASPRGEFRQRPTPVGTFALNPWGLADMHGNVSEWTSDWYGPYGNVRAASIDPQGPISGEKRVIRGGSWNVDGNGTRCALRAAKAPQDHAFNVGFRLAADPRQESTRTEVDPLDGRP